MMIDCYGSSFFSQYGRSSQFSLPIISFFPGKSDPKEMSGDDILIKDPWGESDISAFIIFLSVRNPLKRVIDTLLKREFPQILMLVQESGVVGSMWEQILELFQRKTFPAASSSSSSSSSCSSYSSSASTFPPQP